MRFFTPALGLSLSIAALFSISSPVIAAEEGNQQSPMQAVQPLDNPHQNELRMIALELSSSLSAPELAALDKLRVGFGMVRAIKLVEGDVGEAVEKCAAENPELSEEITARHLSWAETIGTERKIAEDKMDTFVASGAFSNPKKIEAYFEATDKAANYVAAQMDKRIITTPEACKLLHQSMDKTEAELTQLVKAIDWPGQEAEGATLPQDEASE